MAKPLVKKPRLRRLGGIETGLREGKGFSLGELREAGLTLAQAEALGLHVDRRRKTTWPWNVEALKKLLEQFKKPASQPS